MPSAPKRDVVGMMMVASGIIAGECVVSSTELGVVHPGIEGESGGIAQATQNPPERRLARQHIGWWRGRTTLAALRVRAKCQADMLPRHARGTSATARGDSASSTSRIGGTKPEGVRIAYGCRRARESNPNWPLRTHRVRSPIGELLTSPTGRIASAASWRYMALHSMNTVATMLWPVSMSASNSGSR